MKRKQFTVCGIIIVAVLGYVIGWSINIENAILPAVAVIAALVAFYLCKRRVTEVVEDERIHRIGDKAARRVFEVFTVGIALAGVVLITMKNQYPEFATAGFVLLWSVFALMVLYLAFYGYYSRKGV